MGLRHRLPHLAFSSAKQSGVNSTPFSSMCIAGCFVQFGSSMQRRTLSACFATLRKVVSSKPAFRHSHLAPGFLHSRSTSHWQRIAFVALHWHLHVESHDVRCRE